VTSRFNGREWCLTTIVASVVAELLAAKAIQETSRAIALTSTGMSTGYFLKACPSSTIGPDQRN
jgi:hypothetical protein